MSRKKAKRKRACPAPTREMVLAEMIANAEDRSLSFMSGYHGMGISEGTFVPNPDWKGRACAIGAFMAGRHVTGAQSQDLPIYGEFEAQSGLQSHGVYVGNDELPGTMLDDDDSVDVGNAYRAYHADRED